MTFEAHITYDANHAFAVENFKGDGWKFSKIDGDPVLGQQLFCYLTAHGDYAKELLAGMQQRALVISSLFGVQPLRMKIERVIYDTKTGVDEIGGER